MLHVGGRVDALAVKNGERGGIEVDTGKSDVVANVLNCLQSGFGRILVVATTEVALLKTERDLGRAGPSIPRRVKLGLRDVTV